MDGAIGTYQSPELGFTADSNSMAEGREQCTVYDPCCSVPERQRRGTAHVSICQRRKLTLSWLQAPEDTVQYASDAAITSAMEPEGACMLEAGTLARVHASQYKSRASREV